MPCAGYRGQLSFFFMLYFMLAPVQQTGKQFPPLQAQCVSLSVIFFFFFSSSSSPSSSSSVLLLTSPIPHAHDVQNFLNWLKSPPLGFFYTSSALWFKNSKLSARMHFLHSKGVSQPP
jgi:hypothetical protein